MEAAVATAYGVFAAIDRRGIFAALADDPTAVTRDEATQSDLINTVLFVAGGVVTALAVVALLAWLIPARRVVGRLPFRWPWAGLTLLGVAGVTTALVLHAGEDLDRVVVGYVVFAVGAFLVAAAAVLGAVVVEWTRREAVAAGRAADAEEQPPQPTRA